MTGHRAIVVGAGISGLAAAWALAKLESLEVVILDSLLRPGGVIQSERLGDLYVDTGPDSILARQPDGVGLIREMGLGDELVAQQVTRAAIWSDGRVHPLPEGLMLGIPTRIGPLWCSSLLSKRAVVRAMWDLFWPRPPLVRDVAVGKLVSERFGRSIQELLVDPLLGGINAGSTDHLSLQATAPGVAAQLRRGGSVSRRLRGGLAAQRDKTPRDNRSPLFFGLRGGLAELVEQIASQLAKQGATLYLGQKVREVRQTAQGVAVATNSGLLEGDICVVATPAWATSQLLRAQAPRAARLLDSISYASVAVALARIPKDRVSIPTESLSGILVPRKTGMLITAVSFASSKWPHLDTGKDVLVRASIGRIGDGRLNDNSDDRLLPVMAEELKTLLGLSALPEFLGMWRHSRSFPQYEVDHLDRVRTLEQGLSVEAPKVVLAGSYLGGLGIPSCIATSRRAAEEVARRLGLADQHVLSRGALDDAAESPEGSRPSEEQSPKD